MPDFTAYINKSEKVIKEAYEPAWQNMMYIEPTVFLEKIRHEPISSQKIVAAADMGLSGGFAFSAEDKATPKAGRVMYERFVINPVDMFVNIEISDKAIKLGNSAGAMFNLLDNEMKAATAAAKWNMGRSIFGNGTGKLANVTAQSTASDTVYVDSHKYLKEGLIVDFYATGGNSPEVAGVRIKNVKRVAETGGSNNGKYAVTLTEKPGKAIPEGFMTVQLSYNNEITGLGAVFDDSVTTIYGVSKADVPAVKPTVISAEHDLADEIITQALADAHDYHGSDIDVLLAGNAAYRSYVSYLRTNNYRIETTDGTLKGGFKGIKFLFNNREVEIYNENFVPDNEIWGVETAKWKIEDTNWSFMQQKGGGIFNLMEGKSVYRACMANYGNLICSNPGGCVRITDCNTITV